MVSITGLVLQIYKGQPNWAERADFLFLFLSLSLSLGGSEIETEGKEHLSIVLR